MQAITQATSAVSAAASPLAATFVNIAAYKFITLADTEAMRPLYQEQCLALELKGKIGADLGPLGAHAAPDAQSDILNALLALGYSDKEAMAAVKNVPASSGVSDGIKLALKALSKG